MPIALKASWEVHAGVIPGQPIKEFSKRWEYTSKDHEQDTNVGQGIGYHAIFSKMRAEVIDYYLQVSQPRLNNWSNLTFLWY